MLIKEKNFSCIPLYKELVKKYSSVREMFDNSYSILKDKKNFIKIFYIPEINTLDIKNIKIEQMKKLAFDVFKKYHNVNFFINNNDIIYVTKSGINESVQKIYTSRFQIDYINEHLAVFANLGKVIENAQLVNQTLEKKERIYILHWNYYLDNIYINNELYTLEFEVRSMVGGENQYRIQRLNLYK